MKSLNPWVVGAISFVAGALAVVLAMYIMAPGMMITTSESNFGFDETVSRIEASVSSNGWTVQSVIDMNKSMQKHGHPFEPKVRVIKMCHPEYAKRVLTGDRYLSVMMPCTLAVFEGDDGKVYVSQLNVGMIGSMFGGTVAEVMAGSVTEDVAAMLDGLLK
jgi:uncharacterized protein (DUF302 family)